MKPPEYDVGPAETVLPGILVFVMRAVGAMGVLAILLLSLIPGNLQAPLRSSLPGELEHFVAYAAVACCLRGSFAGRGFGIWIVLALAALAGAMEVLQGHVVGREPAIADAVFGAAGAWAGACIGAALSRLVASR
jgi:VanZ family protein